jgi:hypothetical protein
MEPKVQTDTIVYNYKQHNIIRDNIQGKCMSTNVAIPGDRNVIKKEAENILKYKEFTKNFSACGI